MKNYRSDGSFIALNYIIQTGVTITAGSLVWGDVSGTGVIHPITATCQSAPSEYTGLCGVLTETLTGEHTGCVLGIQGVYAFRSGPTASSVIRVGEPVWALSHDQVCSYIADNTASAAPATTNWIQKTGTSPVGICVHIVEGTSVSNVAGNVWVKLMYPHVLPMLTSAAGPY